jgi:hypothetical protein
MSWLPKLKEYKLPTINDYMKEQESKMRKAFENNPFEKPINSKEEFDKAMSEFTQDMDAMDEALQIALKELEDIAATVKSYNPNAN